MLEGLIKLNLAISKLPPPWRVFAYLVLVLNGIMPLLYLDNKMARAVWRTFALTVVVMAGLTKRFGFTRLVGLAQLVSLPLWMELMKDENAEEADSWAARWQQAVLAVNTIALAVGTTEALRYGSGLQEEVVANIFDEQNSKRFYRDEVVIEASAQRVWDTLTDFEQLADWNPLVISVKGDLRPANQIEVRVSIMPRPIKATILRHNPPYELHWLDQVPMGGMEPRFMATIEPLGDHRSRFIIEETFEGPLVALIGGRLDSQMPALYRAMCQGLKQQVERFQLFAKGKNR